MRHLIILFLFGITLYSCNKKAEEADETEAGPVMETAVDSAAAPSENIIPTTYCCSNHNTVHCGTEEELGKLSKNGCTGFN